MIAPHVADLSGKFPQMKFAKFDAGKNPRAFSTQLGIKALPTFLVFRKGEKVGSFVGSKVRELSRFVEMHAEGLA